MEAGYRCRKSQFVADRLYKYKYTLLEKSTTVQNGSVATLLMSTPSRQTIRQDTSGRHKQMAT